MKFAENYFVLKDCRMGPALFCIGRKKVIDKCNSQHSKFKFEIKKGRNGALLIFWFRNINFWFLFFFLTFSGSLVRPERLGMVVK